MKRLLIVAALAFSTCAQAQDRIIYGPDGRPIARESTHSNGSTTIYGSDGRVSGRTSTTGNTTTIYDREGRTAGKAVRGKK